MKDAEQSRVVALVCQADHGRNHELISQNRRDARESRRMER